MLLCGLGVSNTVCQDQGSTFELCRCVHCSAPDFFCLQSNTFARLLSHTMLFLPACRQLHISCPLQGRRKAAEPTSARDPSQPHRVKALSITRRARTRRSAHRLPGDRASCGRRRCPSARRRRPPVPHRPPNTWERPRTLTTTPLRNPTGPHPGLCPNPTSRLATGLQPWTTP